MRILKSLIFSLAIASPVASYAFATGEVTPEEVVQDHQRIILKYADGEKISLPKIVEYKYGMDLDIASVVRVSPDVRACKTMPQLMTYHDSKGELKTVQYRVMSGCKGKN